MIKLLRKLLGKYLINGSYISPAGSSNVENGLKKTNGSLKPVTGLV